MVESLSTEPQSVCVDSLSDDLHNSGLELFGDTWDEENEHVLLGLFGLSSLKSLGMVSKSDCKAFGEDWRC